jgi:hypothetical protein
MDIRDGCCCCVPKKDPLCTVNALNPFMLETQEQLPGGRRATRECSAFLMLQYLLICLSIPLLLEDIEYKKCSKKQRCYYCLNDANLTLVSHKGIIFLKIIKFFESNRGFLEIAA